MNGVIIDDLAVHEQRSLTLLTNLSWRVHVFKLHQKASKNLSLLKPLKYRLSRYSLDVLQKSLVRSSLEYVAWDGLQIERLRLVVLLQVL